jgi:serine/threonine protein phosphatase 1
MPNFYILSDVHGFYNEMRKALDKAGFDPNNENHWLISLGDEIDRGRQPEQVINYLMDLPRAIFVKGNHSILFEDFCERSYPLRYDWSNGTANSILSLAPEAQKWDEACIIAMEKMKPLLDQMVNYFETSHYIFVHSYIPLLKSTGSSVMRYNPSWRTASDKEWEDAMWGNPFQLHKQFGSNHDKTIICGHWHSSWPRMYFDGEDQWGDNANFSPYYMDGLIGIDACTAYSGKVNCIVIEDDLLEE